MRRATFILLAIGLMGLVAIGLQRLQWDVTVPPAMTVEPERGPGSTQAAEAALASPESPIKPPMGARDELKVEDVRPIVQRATVEIQLKGPGGPAVGALVVPHHRFFARRPASSDVAQDEPAQTEFATDASGRVTLEISPSTQSTLHFTWPDSLWQQQVTWTSPRHGGVEFLRVRFPLSARDMPIQVRSFPTGAAIEGASVGAGSASVYTVPKGDPPLLSDHLGVVQVPLGSGSVKDPYRISVAAKGHSRESFIQSSERPDAPVTVWLTQHAALRGVVAFAHPEGRRAPVLGAIVFLAPRAALRDSRLTESAQLPDKNGGKNGDESRDKTVSGVTLITNLIRARATAESNGAWEMPELAFQEQEERLEDYVLVVNSAGHGRLLAEDLFIGPGDEITIEDLLLRGPPLELQVNLADGNPAALAGSLRLIAESDAAHPSVRAEIRQDINSEGRVSIPSLPEGNWRWQLQAQQGANAVTGTLAHSEESPPSQTLALDAHISISGRIRVPVTRPFPIYWRYLDAPKGIFNTVYSDATGRFQIPLAATNSTVQLIAIKTPLGYLGRETKVSLDWDLHATAVMVGQESISGVTLDFPLAKPKYKGKPFAPLRTAK